jgi:D-3-phosphoglycerate dehydrogenase
MGDTGKQKTIVGITEPGYADHRVESRLLEPLGAEVRFLRWGSDRAKLLKQLTGLDIVLVRDTPLIDAEAIGRLREGGGIVRYGVGVDNVDLETAKQHGIKVANISDYGADIEVADHAATLTPALVRRVVSRPLRREFIADRGRDSRLRWRNFLLHRSNAMVHAQVSFCK